MHGFLHVVNAMVLQAVDELSDDGAATEGVPKAKPKAKGSPKPKASPKRRGVLRKPAASASTADPPAAPTPVETPTAKLPMKRPAAKPAPKKLAIKKNKYKDGRYGFVVGTSEVMYVTSLHSCLID